MSVKLYANIVCDYCGKESILYPHGRTKSAREWLKNDNGWTFIEGKDVCPMCILRPYELNRDPLTESED